MTSDISTEIEELKKKILAINPECNVSRPTSRRTAQVTGIQVEENLTVGELIGLLSELNENNFVQIREADWDECAFLYFEEEYPVEDFVYRNVLKQKHSDSMNRAIKLKSGRVVLLTDDEIEEISSRR